ncbi:protein kinase domain-containing protein [Alloacidobacterium sp.]|uniref:protein kinase domain-containing protein n=1 Tax=Alloacidobacterium sp. TaxID=2951999 RepID=UPI002D5D0A9A|nr:protein kinase [Alloacidobacterium sp.]HYK38029.1 protein kinase [Alloacidobacterium sp.]
MPLSANARLGPYEIRSTLGAGGMGEVYQAFDTRLNRSVAIKVLRGDHAITPEHRVRFEREARAIAAFNHPNIVSVYDFGVEADRQYIVSELVEGSSLRSVLTGKPVPLRKLLDIATQVADGLSAAHAAGFVHRDLKPENIMLTKDGRVKIVDFGLARQDPQSVGDSGTTLTLAPDGADSVSGTKAGMVLGTPRYMSPEQALGKPADYRSDQFSFGLILYELASGKQAFAKDSSLETMAAIVREEPPPLDEKLPAPLRWIIDRCLQRETEQRYESTRDLYQELRNLRDHLSEAHSGGALTTVVAPVKRRRWKIPVLCAACMLFAGLLVYLLKPSGQDFENYRYTPFAADTSRSAVWSPDGKAVAYASKVNGIYRVFLRYLNSPVPVQLTHENLDTVPFGWSSDRGHLIVGVSQNSIGLFRNYKLYSVPTVGGQPEFIMDAGCYACDLSRDGKVFAALTDAGVEVSDPVGSPLRPYKPDPFNASANHITSDPWLSFSPDGEQILLLLPIGGGTDEAWLLPHPSESGSPRQISVLSKFPFFTPYPSSSWMPDNQNVVISIQADRKSALHLWLGSTRSGKLSSLTTGTNDERRPSVSPDGMSILYSLVTERYDITSISVEDGTTRTFVTTGHDEVEAAWSLNQPKLTWVTNRSGPQEIWVRLPDGSERPAVTGADFPGVQSAFTNPSLSPDGERIIYSGPGTGTNELGGMWISSVNGGPPVKLTNTPNRYEWGGSWSPDGNQFAYIQSEPIALMIVKTNGNATPSVLKSSIKGQYLPDWSPTGEWITYRDKDGWWLISPDGKTSKPLGKIETPHLAFSKNGKLLYGIETGDTEGNVQRATLFSLDPVTLKKKVIRELGKELAPRSDDEPGIRFSFAPDGKSFVYPTAYYREDLWMLTGYRQPGWGAAGRDDRSKIGSIVAVYGVDRFKDSELHDRSSSCLGERVLTVRNGCVDGNFVPV